MGVEGIKIASPIRVQPARSYSSLPATSLSCISMVNPFASAQADLRNRLMQCRQCKELEQCVLPVGPVLNPTLFILGQSPGNDEVEHGQPFVGQSGQLLDRLLDTAGIQRRTCYISNAVKCHPPRNRPSSADELETCRAYLREELELIRPRSVVLLGKDAWQAWRSRVPWNHGTLISGYDPTEMMGVRVADPVQGFLLVSYHPAFFIRNHQEDEFLKLSGTLRLMAGLPL